MLWTHLDEFEMFKLPEAFSEANIPRLTAEIVLLNMRPKDQHSKWPKEADELIRKLLSEGRSVYQHREFICRSKFSFCLRLVFLKNRTFASVFKAAQAF